MLGDAERVERDAGVGTAACRCQERDAPAHAEADRRNFAAAEGLRAQPLHRNSGIICRALPVEGVEPPPGANFAWRLPSFVRLARPSCSAAMVTRRLRGVKDSF